MVCEPPLFIGDVFWMPLRPSQSHSSKIADHRRAAVARAQQQVLDVIEMAVRHEDQVGLRRLLHRLGTRRDCW